MYVGNDQRGGRTDLNPSIAGKNINYHYNGTGRDTYIAESNGGFYPQKEIAAYTTTFKEQLRVGHFVEREGTAEYMARRNLRMNSFTKNKRSIDEVGNDHSPEGDARRKYLIKNIILGGSSSPTDIYKKNNGWITNQKFKERHQQKELYQTVHSNFLAMPKYHNEKFNTLDPYRDHIDYENQVESEKLIKQKSTINKSPHLTIETLPSHRKTFKKK